MADEKKTRHVTAFELDAAVVGDTDAHPFTFGGFPGLWQVGRPMLPSALGLTVTRMRELVADFHLPLVEVQVTPGKAHDTFEVPAQMIEAGPHVVEPVQRDAELLDLGGNRVPGPTPGGAHPELQPFAAEMIAADTKRLYPGDEAEEIVADLPVEPDSEAEHVALEAAGEPE